MTYFIIWNSDGETYVEVIEPSKLVKDLVNGDYGDDPLFLDTLPVGINAQTDYWPEGSHLIIKGEIVVPKPVEVVMGYKIE